MKTQESAIKTQKMYTLYSQHLRTQINYINGLFLLTKFNWIPVKDLTFWPLVLTVFSPPFTMSLNFGEIVSYTHTQYIYTHVCVCVCVCPLTLILRRNQLRVSALTTISMQWNFLDRLESRAIPWVRRANFESRLILHPFSTHSGQLPHQPLIMTIPQGYAHGPIWRRQFFSWGSLFPGDFNSRHSGKN